MTIGDYTHVIGRSPGGQDLFVSAQPNDGGAFGRFRLVKPLASPTLAIRFLACLADLPLLRSMKPLVACKKEVADYFVQIAQSCACLQGFVQELHQTYGDGIADMCLRECALKPEKPLTAGQVSSAVKHADQESQRVQMENDKALKTFLVPDVPDTRCEMNVCCDEILGAEASPLLPWKGRFSENAAAFIEAYVTTGCKALPEYSRIPITVSRMRQKADEALALYQEAVKVPGIGHECLDEIFKSMAIAKRAPEEVSAIDMRELLREKLVMSQLSPLLDCENVQSFFSRKVSEVAQAHAQEVAALFPKTVQKTIVRNMAEYVRCSIVRWSREFACKDDTESIIAELTPRLETHLGQVLEGHCAALVAISDSTRLNESQKGYLKKIAAGRRLDTHQVLSYEVLARKVGDASREIATHLAAGAFGRARDALCWIAADIGAEIRAMGKHGNEVWEPISLAGGNVIAELIEQFIDLALSDLDEKQARSLLAGLTGEDGKHFVQGLYGPHGLHGQSIFICVMFLSFLVEKTALRSGLAPEDARKLSKEVVASNNGPKNPPPALTAAFARSSGEVDPAFHAAMAKELAGFQRKIAEHWVKPEMGEDFTPLSDGTLVGTGFLLDVLRDFCPRIQVGNEAATELVDRNGWETLTLVARKARVEAGFAKLLAFCDNDLGEAQRVTLMLNQGLTAPFLTASILVGGEHSPLKLQDGRLVMPAAYVSRSCPVTLHRERLGGELSLHIDYSVEGIRDAAYDNQRIFLDLHSTLHYAFDARVQEDGALVLQGPVRYSVDLKESAWWGDYAEPVIADLRKETYKAHDALLAFAREKKNADAEWDLRLLDLLNAFDAHPSPEAALSIVSQPLFDDKVPGAAALRTAVEAAESPIDPGVMASMAAIRAQVLQRLGEGILSDFVTARKSVS